MDNINYKVNRDEIYVGLLCNTKKDAITVYPDGLYDFEMSDEEDIYHSFDNQQFLFKRKSHLCYNNGCFTYEDFVRTMLFVLDENKCANDLLYDSPHYPIFNISDDELCMQETISLKHDVFEMGRLLKHFDYPEQLGFFDIVKIKEFFFGDFSLNNCNLFGIYETGPDHSGAETYDSFGKHRTFNDSRRDGILPTCYFEMFWETRNCGKRNEIGLCDRFVPNVLEGPIRKLEL
ncbi:MAG: hypothetical protein IJO33_01540 [Bacilli bacterium]|nr:hypothetical protein [Bacilli bacterium]